MIPVKHAVRVEGNLPSTRKTKFGIGNASWVLQSLADLYSNRDLAVVREYSTNAYDAAVERALLEGGDVTPIEVTLPNAMYPQFKVRDYGYGMSEDTLHEVYTQFGDSTKRESNAMNGILGFGCKSALAYTSNFTVTSIHGGIKTTVLVHRNNDWEIEMDTMSMETTDEPSGTEVTVPVGDTAKFAHIANDFYKFWLPGTVRLRHSEAGKWFVPEHNVGDEIVPGLYFSTHYAESYIVMGNVAYRINNPSALFTNTKMSRINFVAYVDNGDVEFTPSREDLKYTDHTINTLKKVISDFEAKIVVSAQKDIDTAPTHAEAYKRWAKWTQRLGRNMFDDLTFKGDKFKSEFDVKGSRYDSSAYSGSTHWVNSWFVEQMERTMIVTEFALNLHSRHKTMARDYAKLKGWTGRYIIFTTQKAADINSPWITKDQFVQWETLKAELPKPPPKPRQAVSGPKRIAGSFDFITANGWVYEKPLPDTTKDVFYITVRQEKNTPVRDILRHLNSQATVIVLPQNRLNKFNRENPEVKPFLDWAQSQVVIDMETLLTDDAKEVKTIDSTTREWLRVLPLDILDDKSLAEAKALVDREAELWNAYRNNVALARMTGMVYNVKEWKATSVRPSILTKYPLLRDLNAYRSVNKAELAIYMNAVHAQTKGKK